MTAKTAKTAATKTETTFTEAVEDAVEMASTAATDPAKAAEDVRARSEAWAKDAGDKARAAALKATEDFQASSATLLEAEMAAGTRGIELARTLVDARAEAAAKALKSGDLAEAVAVEQAYAKAAMETLTSGLREIAQIRMDAFKAATAPFAARATEAFGGFAKA
ncbi:phasin family protein [Rhodovulum sp. DZ06]|uniref:phasin family protein n=1 Tax=Rhodovulum sp. DZ06 TaxID=3425126 RepID=UPI003D33A73A